MWVTEFNRIVFQVSPLAFCNGRSMTSELLGINAYNIRSRGALRTKSNIYDGALLREYPAAKIC